MGDRTLHDPTGPLEPGAAMPAEARVEDELRALIRVSSAVAAAHRLEDVLEIVAEESRRILGAASVSISRWEPEEDRLRTLINVGALAPGEERWPDAELWPLADFPHITEHLERHEASVVVFGDPRVPASEAAVLESLGKGSCLRVPIVFEGTSWGTLEAFSEAGTAFSLERVPYVDALAAQVAVAIGRAELFSRVAAMAYEDPLTGMSNRRALEERLEAAVGRAVATGGDLALLFCDLDRLKELNDSEGHEIGDQALVAVAQALTDAAAAYPGSSISRIGGDEFCVLLEGHDAVAAQALAQEADRRLPELGGRQLSISCGAAQLQHPSQRPADLFRAADAAQYVAKRDGRGRVYVAEAGMAVLPEQAPAPPQGRRRLRDAPETPSQGLVQHVLELLDRALADASAIDRLEAVAVAFADAFDAGSWAISSHTAGEDVVRTLFEGGRRTHRVSGVPSLRFRSDSDAYPLSAYPATAAVLERDGAFCTLAGDPDGDPAEQALLAVAGYRSVTAAAARANRDGWLLELFADRRSGPLEGAAGELRLLTAEAVRDRD